MALGPGFSVQEVFLLLVKQRISSLMLLSLQSPPWRALCAWVLEDDLWVLEDNLWLSLTLPRPHVMDTSWTLPPAAFREGQGGVRAPRVLNPDNPGPQRLRHFAYQEDPASQWQSPKEALQNLQTLTHSRGLLFSRG